MELRLHNSLTRQTETFVPLDPQRVTMYVCGPTVYNYVHIGNARPAVVFGVLADLLRRHHGGVVYARNITDVDDKINRAAAELRVPISVVTEKYAAAYHEDMAALGVPPPDVEPHAASKIPAADDRVSSAGNAQGSGDVVRGPGRNDGERNRSVGYHREDLRYRPIAARDDKSW